MPPQVLERSCFRQGARLQLVEVDPLDLSPTGTGVECRIDIEGGGDVIGEFHGRHVSLGASQFKEGAYLSTIELGGDTVEVGAVYTGWKRIFRLMLFS